jgi:hypothetical protein
MHRAGAKMRKRRGKILLTLFMGAGFSGPIPVNNR